MSKLPTPTQDAHHAAAAASRVEGVHKDSHVRREDDRAVPNPLSLLVMGLAAGAVTASGRISGQGDSAAVGDVAVGEPLSTALPPRVMQGEVVRGDAVDVVDVQALAELAAEMAKELSQVAQFGAQSGGDPVSAGADAALGQRSAAAVGDAADVVPLAVPQAPAALAAAMTDLTGAGILAGEAAQDVELVAQAAEASAAGGAGGAAAGGGAAAAATAVSSLALVAAGVALVGVAAAAGGKSDEAPGDATAPTATVGLSAPSLKAGETATVTITFSEPVAGFDSDADVTVASGTLQKMSSSDGGRTWTGTFTPTADLEDASNVVSLAASYTDVAGNAGTAAQSGNYAVDTQAPGVALDGQAPSIDVKGNDGTGDPSTISITYDSDLDAANPPSVNAFSIDVNVGGVLSTREVDSVSIDGKVLTLTLKGANIPTGATVTLAYTDQAGDGQGILDLAGNEAASGTFIKIADGYIRGARIYIDTNGNGTADPQSDYYAGETDAQGNFFLPADAPSGTIIAVGGVNIDTGVPNDVPLKAPAGSTTVNPLTTLVQAVLETNVGTDAASQTPEAVAAATQAVATALGITGAGADLTRFDPVAAAATDPSAQKAAAKIATVFALAEGAGAGSGSTVLDNLTSQVQSAIENGATVALDDAATLGAVLQGTNTSLEVQSKIADAAKAIADAQDLGDISKAQSQFLDTVAPKAPLGLDLLAASDTGSSDTDNLTHRTDVTVRVSFDATSGGGVAAVAGDQVFVLQGGAVAGAPRVLVAQDIARGHVDIQVAGLEAGQNTFVARIVDQSGKASDAALSPILQVTVDTSAPAVAGLGVVAVDDVLNASEQGSTLSGTAEALAKVTLTLGSASHTVTADADGLWSYALQAADIQALGQGVVQVAAVVTDPAGNASAAVTRAFTVDTLAPTAMATLSAVADDVAPEIGPLQSGATSNDQTLSMTGTVGSLGAGERLVVYDGGVRLGVAAVDTQAGTWSFITPNLPNGAHQLTVRVEDAAGNAGNASAPFAVTVDTTVPAATAVVTGFLVGASNDQALQGALTNDATPRLAGALSQALGAGETVVVFDGPTRLGTAFVDGSAWSFDTSGLSDGAHAFSAVVEAAGGNQGARSAVRTLTVDTAAPAAPTIAAIAGNDIVNASEQTASISGAAEPGATVTLTLGAQARVVQAGANGAWSYTLTAGDLAAMGQGAETVTASARDTAGNLSAVAAREILVDTQAPAQPTVLAVAADDIINLAERGQTQAVAGGAGSVEAGSTVAVTIGGATYRITAAQDGSWMHTLNDADYVALGQGGGRELQVRATDAAGNAGASKVVSLTIDTVAPVLSPFTLDAGSDSGTQGDGRSKVATPTFKAVSEKGAALQVLVDGNIVAATVTDGVDLADAPGSVDSIERLVTLDSPLIGDKTYTITLRAIDGAGNATSRTGAYTLDTTPAAPASFGTVAGDDVVNVVEATSGVTVSGQAGAYASIVLTHGAGVALGTAPIKAGASGAWSYTLTTAELQAMGQGAETLSVVTRDAAGNDSAAATRQITIDTSAPDAAPTIAEVVDNVPANEPETPLTAGGTTNDQTLTLNGTASGAAVGDRVVVFDGATRLGEAAIVDGVWAFTTPNLSNATHSLSARVVDAAGNAGPASSAFAVTVNAAVPTATAAVTGFRVGVDNATALQGAVTNDTSPAVAGTVNGTLTQGDVVVVYDGSTRLGQAVVNGSGWLYATDLTSGAHSFSAVVETSGGTQGVRGAGVALTVDTTPPAAPVINTVAGDNVVNAIEQGVAITGTAEAGARVALTLGSVGQAANVQTVTAGANGAWSYTLKLADITALGQGQVTISATATDAAGNASGSGSRQMTIDTVAPGAPVVGKVAGDGIINAAERAAGVSIAGTTDAGEGARVTVTVAGNSYRVTANAEGQWSYRLTDADFAALGQGTGKTIVAAATDAAGNTGTPSTGNAFAIDTVAPTLSPVALLAASDSGAKGDGISNVVAPEFGFTAESGVTFRGRVGDGDFQDIPAVQDGASLKVTVPAGALAEGSNTLTLRVVDAAGNFAERSAAYTLDTSAPALAIGNDEQPQSVPNIAGGGIVYTFTFSQPVTGFTADDVVVTGGTKGIFSGVSASEYTLVVVPTAGQEGALGVSVAANAAQDVAGNGSAAQQAAPQAYDFRAPTVVITDNQASTTNADITYTFTFSEAVTGFTAEDIAVANGTKGAIEGSGGVYTLVVSPAQGFEGNVTVDVAAGVAADLRGNPSMAAVQGVQAVDTRAPVFSSGNPNAFVENGTGVAYTASASDASGPVTYSLTGGADKDLFTLDPDTGALRFQQAPNFETPADAGANNVYDVRITATDAFDQATSKDVSIVVTNANEVPVAGEITPKIVALNVAQTGAISVASAFSDVDAGDALTFSAANLPAGLSLAADGSLRGVASVKTTTPVEVTVTATDKGGLTATKAFALSVVEAPAVSSLTSDVAAARQGAEVVFTMKLSEAVSITPAAGQELTLTLSVDGGPSLNAIFDAADSQPDDPTGGVLKFNAVVVAGNDAQVQVASLSGATIKGSSTQQDLTSPVGTEVAQFVIDNTAPGATIAFGAAALSDAVSTTPVSITFSEKPEGFDPAEDLQVGAGGALGAGQFDASGRVWTATYTAEDGYAGSASVTLKGQSYADAAGNAGAGGSDDVVIDRSNPGVLVTDDRDTTTNGAITYTFTFSEPVTGFTADDVVVSQGTKGAFAGSGSAYTLVVTPPAGFEGNVTAGVAAGAAKDAAGNDSTAAVGNVQAVDTRAPSVSITDNRASTTNADITYTFTFSEPVTGFTADDVSVANGTKGAFNGSGSVYTLVVTPSQDFEGNVTAGVAAGAAVDGVGNQSTAAQQNVQVADTRAPVFQGGRAAAFAENGTGVAYTANAVDASGPVTYALTGGADQGLFGIDADTGAVRFLNAPDFETVADAGGDNVYDIQIRATDALGQFSTRDVAISVTNVNDNPVAMVDSNAGINTVAENAAVGTPVGITASATDADTGATITGYALTNDAGGRFAIDSVSGVVAVKGALDFEASASHTVTVQATSSDGSTQSQAFTIAVTNVNEAPTVGTVAPPTVSVGVPYQFSLGARFSDPDAGDVLKFSVTAGALPEGLQLNPDTGVISGTALAKGSASLTVTAIDKGMLTQSVAIGLSVQEGISFTYANQTFVVPTAPVGNEVFDVRWAAQTGAESGLFILEGTSDTVDYELWVAVDNGAVAAYKAFTTDAGFMQRVVDSPDGTLYFQIVNATLQRDSGGNLSGVTQSTTGPATTLYAVNPANVLSILNAAGSADTLAGLSGVTQVHDFFRGDLGITDEATQGSLIALLDGYVDDGYWTTGGAAPGSIYASSIQPPFSDQAPMLSYLGVLNSQMNVQRLQALGAEMTDAFPIADIGLFLRTGATTTSPEFAYHFNPATGVLSQISTTLFDALSQGVQAGFDSLPSDVVFLSGTDGNDTLGNASASNTIRQWLAAGGGNDSLQGGAGNDLIFGGGGGDSMSGGDGGDVLSGMAGDDRLRGQLGADTLYGGPGADRIQYFGPSELAGDVVTGSSAIWEGGNFVGIGAGADYTTEDRIQLLDSGVYDFNASEWVTYIDRVDVVSGLAGSTAGTYKLVLTLEMAATADQDRNGVFGDIRVVGYQDDGTATPLPTSSPVMVDASVFDVTMSLVVKGQDGSGVTGAEAFGGLQGSDTLIGGAGGDYLNAGQGDDRLMGGAGPDTLIGGAGADRFMYYTPEHLSGDVITGSDTLWDGNAGTLAAGADPVTLDRFQVFGAGTYDFSSATSISFVDRIDVVSGVDGASKGDYVLVLSPAMASSADQNANGSYGDVRVVGYHGNDSAPTTANIKVDGTALSASQGVVVLGQDGSGSAATPFGGMQGNDTLIGAAGRDSLNGGLGNDEFYGRGGDDTIDGGAGIDLATYVGNRAEYQVSITNGVVSLVDTVSGRDGTDLVSNVERFEFADGLYKVNSAGTGLALDAVEITSALDGVTNFDVTSAIVLQASEPVTAVAGKSIRIMNDGGAGFRGEAGDNDQSIDVGSASVTIQGHLIIIRPPFDLDLANVYHIEIDAGAFVASSSGLGSVAVSDPSLINFSTVVPASGLLGVSAAVQSQSMDTSTGGVQNSFKWLDVEGVGSPSSSQGTVLDLLGDDIALVFKDYDTAAASETDAFDGIGAPDFYLRANNFGTGDLLYVDNQAPAQGNLLSQSQVLADVPVEGVTQISFGSGVGGLGGVLEIDLANSNAVFSAVNELPALIGSLFPPIESA